MLKVKLDALDAFTQSYLEAALWSSTDDDGNPLDHNYGFNDFAEQTLAGMVADCAKFQEQNAELLTDDNNLSSAEYSTSERAGHDFWLTRNGHGAGFWDRDWAEPAATLLTQASKAFGGVDLHVGDDGRLHA